MAVVDVVRSCCGAPFLRDGCGRRPQAWKGYGAKSLPVLRRGNREVQILGITDGEGRHADQVAPIVEQAASTRALRHRRGDLDVFGVLVRPPKPGHEAMAEGVH